METASSNVYANDKLCFVYSPGSTIAVSEIETDPQVNETLDSSPISNPNYTLTVGKWEICSQNIFDTRYDNDISGHKDVTIISWPFLYAETSVSLYFSATRGWCPTRKLDCLGRYNVQLFPKVGLGHGRHILWSQRYSMILLLCGCYRWVQRHGKCIRFSGLSEHVFEFDCQSNNDHGGKIAVKHGYRYLRTGGYQRKWNIPIFQCVWRGHIHNRFVAMLIYSVGVVDMIKITKIAQIHLNYSSFDTLLIIPTWFQNK